MTLGFLVHYIEILNSQLLNFSVELYNKCKLRTSWFAEQSSDKNYILNGLNTDWLIR